MKKQIIMAKLLEFGGTNTHLQTLVKYWGSENIKLILEDESQAIYLKNIDAAFDISFKVMPKLHRYAHLIYPSLLSNFREFCKVLISVVAVWLVCVKNGLADLTINVAEPEKYLYLFWLPFVKVTYIIHSTPENLFTPFTSYTCNSRLGKRKKIVTVSNANRKLICENWRIKDDKQSSVKIIYNCILEGESSTDTPKFLNKNFRYIVTMGHVVEYKNPSLWLEVAKRLTLLHNDICFIWLGNGPQWEALCNETKDTERIIFEGLVTHPSVYLKNAAIYYQPSLSETHGIAVLEAMYHRLPCVVSDAGGLPESVLNGYNGLTVLPTSIDEHVDALAKLIPDTKLCARYGANGYKRYMELFSYDAFKKRLDDLYLSDK